MTRPRHEPEAQSSTHGDCRSDRLRMPNRARTRPTRAHGLSPLTLTLGAGLLILSTLSLAACAAVPTITQDSVMILCKIHNSSEMKALCEVPGGK